VTPAEKNTLINTVALPGFEFRGETIVSEEVRETGHAPNGVHWFMGQLGKGPEAESCLHIQRLTLVEYLKAFHSVFIIDVYKKQPLKHRSIVENCLKVLQCNFM